MGCWKVGLLNSWVAGGGQGFRMLVKGWGGREGSWRRRRGGRKGGGKEKRPEGLCCVESAQADLRTTVPLGDRAMGVCRTSVTLCNNMTVCLPNFPSLSSEA